MEYVTLNNGIKMPMAGIGTFLLTPDEAEQAVTYALKDRTNGDSDESIND